MKAFSVRTIEALANAVTGGPADENSSPVGLYRSGPKLERFFGALNIELRIGNRSRVPAVIDTLTRVNRLEPEVIVSVIEAVSSPSEYLDDPKKHDAVVDYLNKRLEFDGYELRSNGIVCKLYSLETSSFATKALEIAIKNYNYDSVQADIQRALAQANNDPEDAITSACSTVESICKCILDDMGKDYPAKQDIRGLVTEVIKHLNLSPGREDFPPHLAADIKQILSGLITVISGIGALRTHAGDAHGRGKRKVLVDARIARLAIHAASTISLFYFETWSRMRKNAVNQKHIP